MNGKILPVEFYLRDTPTVAKDLLNCLLYHQSPKGLLVGRISETEAYTPDDPASHSFRGKTPRNSAMFLKGGHTYLYLIYGVYYCLNAVTEEEGVGSAVLIRAVEPLEGISVMEENRKTVVSKQLQRGSKEQIRHGRNLCGGPGKLCQAFGLTHKQNEMPLTKHDTLWITEPENESLVSGEIVATPRIGISVATEKRWRFHFANDNFLSR
jgi:DNA-3-methyladenine glycosylase